MHRRDAAQVRAEVPRGLRRLSPERHSPPVGRGEAADQRGVPGVRREWRRVHFSRRGHGVHAQRRTVAGRAAIEEQFRNYITGEDRPTAEEVAKAETSKEAQLSALEDAEQQLMTMLEKADIDGDGDLSKDEFFLAGGVVDELDAEPGEGAAVLMFRCFLSALSDCC